MATTNKLDCLATAGNTGTGTCFLEVKNIVGAILAPRGYEIDLSQPDLKATLLAAVQETNKFRRLFPVYDFINTTDSTEGRTTQTFNTGARKTVREGFNIWKFQFTKGGLSLLQQLRKFNGSNYDFFFIDSEMKILGIQGSSDTKLRAIPSDGGEFWADAWKLNDGSKIAEYSVEFIFNVKYSTDYVSFVKADFDLPSTINGLQDVKLAVTATATPGTYHVKAVTTSTGTNMAELYPTEMVDDAMWVVKNAATGAVIPVTGITIGQDSSGEDVFVLALNTADAAYPAAAASLTIDLVAPAALAAAGIEGFESTGKVSIVRN